MMSEKISLASLKHSALQSVLFSAVGWLLLSTRTEQSKDKL